MIQDQKESGLIESIFDGIARITGLNTAFYAELLFNMNTIVSITPETANENDENDVHDTLSHDELPNAISVVLRSLHDLLLPIIFLNNTKMLNHFSTIEISTLDVEKDTNDVEGDLNNFFNLKSEIFNSDNVENINVDINILNNISDFLEESELFNIANEIIENINSDETINNNIDFAYAYTSMILEINLSFIEKAKIDNILSSEIASSLTKATLNYLSLLAQTLAYSNDSSLLNPDNAEVIFEDLTDEDIDYDDTIEENVEDFIDIEDVLDDSENEENISKALLLVMGLEREYIQAPLLTQTTSIYEGDLVWGTGQELEVYCSFDSLGHISDIFLNPLE
jgi:hypothetical protein